MTIIRTLVSIFLTLTVLTGGKFTLFPPVQEPPERTGLRFEEVEYRRPEMDKLNAAAERVTELVASGADAAEAAESLNDFFRLYDSFYSMSNIARIRSFSDVGDIYYAGEYACCLEQSAEAEMLLERVYLACGKSEKAASFEKEYFGDGFLARYGKDAAERYSAAAVELRRREAELVRSYYELIAEPTIRFDGRELSLSDCLAADGNEQYDILLEYYRQYSSRIAYIYTALVRVRTELAHEMGYGSVWEMYAEPYGRDLSRTEVNTYLSGIAERIAPLYRNSILSSAAKEVPALGEDTLLTLLETAANAMGGKTREAFDYMQSHAMGDFSASPEKAEESFTVYLSDLNTPFAFVSAVGDLTDVFTVFHEFGHFTQMFSDGSAECSLDLSECFSQGMELFGLEKCSSSLDRESFQLLRRLKYEDLLSVLVRQGLFARFEDMVYSLDPDTLSASTLNSLSLACAREFGLSDILNEEYCSYLWMDVTHFILYPYYVLSYPVSADAALQLHTLEQEREGAGIAAFETLMKNEEASFLSALRKAGLHSPFDEGRISALVEELARFA